MDSNTLLCETRTYTEIAYTHHHSYSQLILPLQGKLAIKTENHELSLDENHLFYLPPESSHSYHSDGKNKFLVLDIPRSVNPIVLGDIFNYERYQILDERWKAIRYLLLEETRRLNKRALSDLVNYVCGFLKEETRPISIEYIHNNFEKTILLQKLASLENFNVSYYIEWFNKKTGMTPNAYIQKLRLEKAKKYLLNTELSLLMISQLVGYEQQSSLTRLFKNFEDMSPSVYRKRYREMGKNSPI